MDIFEVVTANLVGILRGARKRIIEMSLFDAKAFDEVVDTLNAWARRPDAAFWFAMAWAEGIKTGVE
jgi:hypothetical protein